jgi:hypothetical protein
VFVWVWWCALHLLLVVANVLVAWSWAPRLGLLAVVAGHAFVRRPVRTPTSIIVTEDATCLVPEWGLGPALLGPRTIVCTYWVRLETPRRDILLFIDQLGPEQWAGLRALLERVRVRRGARSAPAGGTNLS